MLDTSGRVFQWNMKALKAKPRVIANKGGTRSGKTFSIMSLLVLLAYQCKRAIQIDVVSESLPHLKRGALHDIETIIEAIGLLEDRDYTINRSDHEYTFTKGSKIRFFSADNWGKVKGSKRHILFINEANRLEWEVYRQLAVRTSELIMLDWNPDSEYWYEEQGISQEASTIEIHSTYKDNDYLSEMQVAEIERNKERDANWWRVYGLGETGQLLGVIYPNAHLIDSITTDVMAHCQHYLGLDFGFSNDPTALVDIYIDERGRKVYLQQLVYQTGMTNPEIAAAMRSLGVSRSVDIYADAAEPKSIEEIHRAGFNIKPAYKRDLNTQIQYLQQFDLYITKDSLDLIKERRNYTWRVDKNGKNLNEPIDLWNHLMDAMRYGIYTPLMGRPHLHTKGAHISRLPNET